jgi:hypothetical protein
VFFYHSQVHSSFGKQLASIGRGRMGPSTQDVGTFLLCYDLRDKKVCEVWSVKYAFYSLMEGDGESIYFISIIPKRKRRLMLSHICMYVYVAHINVD